MRKSHKLQTGICHLRSHLAICLALLIIAAVAGSVLSCRGGAPAAPSAPSAPSAVQDSRLPAHGDATLLANVISPPDEGREHIWPDHPVQYKTMPPTSGPHFPDPTAPGFYIERPAFGYLVHSLEHGSVVIYYNPGQLSSDAEKDLKALIESNSNAEYGIVAVPDADFVSPFILTAWNRMLKLDKYDPRVVRAFAAEYLGRGPENPDR
jgi:hypothetical protein